MPTLSLYAFARDTVDSGGPFKENHETFSVQVPITDDEVEIDDIALADLVPFVPFPFLPGLIIDVGPSEHRSVLAMLRPDSEDVVDLAAMYNSFRSIPTTDPAMPLVTLKQFAQTALTAKGGTLRGTPANPDGDVRSSFVHPGAVLTSILANLPVAAPTLIRPFVLSLELDIHLQTPAGCPPYEGTVRFFVAFGVTRLKVQAAVVSGNFTDPGTSPCTDDLNNQLDRFISTNISSLNAYYAATLPPFLSQVAPGSAQLYGRAYRLPGDGKKTGSGVGDADVKASIGLAKIPEFSSQQQVPRPPETQPA